MSKWHIGTPTEFGTFNGSHVNDEEGDSVCQMYGLPVNIRLEDIDPRRYKKELERLHLISVAPELLDMLIQLHDEVLGVEVIINAFAGKNRVSELLEKTRAVISLARNEE